MDDLIETFLDHNNHVGVTFYSADASELAKSLTTRLRDLSGDRGVVVLVRVFHLTVLREILEPLVVNRTLNVPGENEPSPVSKVRVDYRAGTVRVARVWLECFLSRSPLTLADSRTLRLFKRTMSG